MERHGASSHFLRPDGVYITSVLQPTVGYDPVGDSQAVSAQFVAPGGLAGPVATMHRARRGVGILGSVTGTWRERWAAFVMRIRTNLATNKFLQDMRIHPAQLPPGTAIAVIPTAPGVIPGPPSDQSPSGAASMVYSANVGDPPNMGAGVTAVAMAPAEAAAPVGMWQGIVQSGDPPIVSLRAGADALRRWFTHE